MMSGQMLVVVCGQELSCAILWQFHQRLKECRIRRIVCVCGYGIADLKAHPSRILHNRLNDESCNCADDAVERFL